MKRKNTFRKEIKALREKTRVTVLVSEFNVEEFLLGHSPLLAQMQHPARRPEWFEMRIFGNRPTERKQCRRAARSLRTRMCLWQPQVSLRVEGDLLLVICLITRLSGQRQCRDSAGVCRTSSLQAGTRGFYRLTLSKE